MCAPRLIRSRNGRRAGGIGSFQGLRARARGWPVVSRDFVGFGCSGSSTASGLSAGPSSSAVAAAFAGGGAGGSGFGAGRATGGGGAAGGAGLNGTGAGNAGGVDFCDLGRAFAGSAAVSAGFAPSCRSRRYTAPAPTPIPTATTMSARRQNREGDATTRSGRGVGFLRPPFSAAAGNLVMTASSAFSIASASLKRADGLFAIALSTSGWNDAAAASPGRAFTSDGTG